MPWDFAPAQLHQFNNADFNFGLVAELEYVQTKKRTKAWKFFPSD
jgi:hypothetical protein